MTDYGLENEVFCLEVGLLVGTFFCTDTLEGSKFAQEQIENLSINGLKRPFILVLLFVPFLRGKKLLSVNPLLRKS
jgi:hypothetical protein